MVFTILPKPGKYQAALCPNSGSLIILFSWTAAQWWYIMHSPPDFATCWCKCTVPVILRHSSAVNDLFSFTNQKDFSKATRAATSLISEKSCQINLTHSFFFFMRGIKDAQKEDRQKGNKQSQIIQI